MDTKGRALLTKGLPLLIVLFGACNGELLPAEDLSMAWDLGLRGDGPSAREDATIHNLQDLRCEEDEYVENHQCVACAPGTTNAAGDDAVGDDTACDPILCANDEHVDNHQCVPCAAGTTHAAGDDASGDNTACDSILCAKDEHVVNNRCVACAAGTTNAAGDIASGADTPCDADACAENQHVDNHQCVPCAAGTKNAAGDDASGSDTSCERILCAEDERVRDHRCLACVAGTTNAAGDDASGSNTTCDSTLCAQNQHVVSYQCVACPAGTTNAAGDDASGSDTACDATLCDRNQYVASHQCVACPAGTTNAAGDDASASDTACDATLCAQNQHVVSHQCVDCPTGTTNAAGDDASGADTSCTSSSVVGSVLFNTLPLASTLPSGWELIWDDAGQTIVQGIQEILGSTFLAIQSKDSPYTRLAVVPTGFSASDMEVLFLTRTYANYFSFGLRIQGASATGHNAYLLRKWYGGRVELIRQENSGTTTETFSTLADRDDCTICASGDFRYWVRFRVQGADVMMKIWKEGTAEPSAWFLNATDADPLVGAGTFGLVTYTNYITGVERIAWASAGATASF